jgi:transcriptional regulator with XRE-family HTH domain
MFPHMENPGRYPERAFGSRLRAERERRGWRLEDLAAHMTGHGLARHESFYAKIETGATRIKLNEADAIARALDLSLTQMTADHLDELSSRLEQIDQAIAQHRAIADLTAHSLADALARRAELLDAIAADQAARKATPDTTSLADALRASLAAARGEQPAADDSPDEGERRELAAPRRSRRRAS